MENISEDIEVDYSKVSSLNRRFLKLLSEEELDEKEIRPILVGDGDGDGDDIRSSSSFARRCLIAAGGNDEEVAYRLGIESLQWRSRIKPSQINIDSDFPIAASQNTIAFGDHSTKDGRPVVYINAENWKPWKYSTEEYVRMMAFMWETCFQRIKKQREEHNDNNNKMLYAVFDMKGMSKLVMMELGKLIALAKIATVYYPESIEAIVVNADILTMTTWAMISPLLDNRTRNRVKIFSDDFEDYLDSHIGLENIGPALGGKRKEEWPNISKESVQCYVEKYH